MIKIIHLWTFLNTFYNIIKLGTNKQKGSKIYDFAAFRKEKYKKITFLTPPFPNDRLIQERDPTFRSWNLGLTPRHN